ncbi:diacylglycerol/lipid kinase family protein [Terriglobus saanensis]|uniref:Diacylglycerol kinase catalytic region n=1 Tax=Terriglobus saanensis (strain ATCC BAA-1853 / DSM 23119 / SP1PR4) TaxID=401053 RepID=E8UYC0_TERSS|nr:diacylglycerol kinase family protein [Terriglobus saanensis]ADV82008.1 diacylglycerol kinase catalytic region [Terriglobus saanensis SP1PR4]
MSATLLLYNPKAGGGAVLRQLPTMLAALRLHFPDVESIATTGPASAGPQVATAAQAGTQLVIVCGGDGTLFEAMQGAVHQKIALAIIPFGTGNVIARDLGLSMKPLQAIQQLAQFEKRRVPVGTLARPGDAAPTYFLTATGAGFHAELMSLPKPTASASRMHYFFQGLNLIRRNRVEDFDVRIGLLDGTEIALIASELLILRARSFGGILNRWRPGNALTRNDLLAILTRKHNRLALFLFILRCLLGQAPLAGVESADNLIAVRATEILCTPRDYEIEAEADGEPFGILPLHISTIPDALTLLLPKNYPNN